MFKLTYEVGITTATIEIRSEKINAFDETKITEFIEFCNDYWEPEETEEESPGEQR
jgi:hypothetical protein